MRPTRHETSKKTGVCKFSEKLGQHIVDCAKAGMTDEQIAAEVGVCRATLANWKGKYKGFTEALDHAKNLADELVVASLFSRAVGYSHPEVKLFYNSKTDSVMSEVVTKHYPPDTLACIFWLKNRQRHKWRDRQEHTGKDGGPIQLAQTLADDIKKARERATRGTST